MISMQARNVVAEKIKILRQDHGPNLVLVGPVQLPVQLEGREVTFQWYTWLNLNTIPPLEGEILDVLSEIDFASSQQSSVLVYGDFANNDQALVRFHSICHTGDIFGSKRCDCGYQMQRSLNMIAQNGCGALFYIANHEGRGIGLFSKSLAYLLQEQGYDTVEANNELGYDDDQRSYDEAIRVLRSMRRKPVSLITNNPKKLQSLREQGLLTDQHVSIWGAPTKHNKRYLRTKIAKSGHLYETSTRSVEQEGWSGR
ncbi:GTP cyclohydrolase II [Paenibacillus sp.]|uniref:GTP cyclohydrolase II n=1 Tax=Paenibacillus sp. TaxID=58172 RepID=UPI002D2EB088|nr:GTP cyclohydrolase II [Paenibacillus sp.]HZG87903.1 GTP cyclohydrolase II [Paenibacillus sp.]